jgi:hypothetical protein
MIALVKLHGSGSSKYLIRLCMQMFNRGVAALLDECFTVHAIIFLDQRIQQQQCQQIIVTDYP